MKNKKNYKVRSELTQNKMNKILFTLLLTITIIPGNTGIEKGEDKKGFSFKVSDPKSKEDVRARAIAKRLKELEEEEKKEKEIIEKEARKLFLAKRKPIREEIEEKKIETKKEKLERLANQKVDRIKNARKELKKIERALTEEGVEFDSETVEDQTAQMKKNIRVLQKDGGMREEDQARITYLKSILDAFKASFKQEEDTYRSLKMSDLSDRELEQLEQLEPLERLDQLEESDELKELEQLEELEEFVQEEPVQNQEPTPPTFAPGSYSIPHGFIPPQYDYAQGIFVPPYASVPVYSPYLLPPYATPESRIQAIKYLLKPIKRPDQLAWDLIRTKNTPDKENYEYNIDLCASYGISFEDYYNYVFNSQTTITGGVIGLFHNLLKGKK